MTNPDDSLFGATTEDEFFEAYKEMIMNQPGQEFDTWEEFLIANDLTEEEFRTEITQDFVPAEFTGDWCVHIDPAADVAQGFPSGAILESINGIPVTTIGLSSSLQQMYYPENSHHSITSIGLVGSGADFEIPNSITIIADEAFEELPLLQSVVLPNSITTIGNRAFEGCPLSTVTLPSSITKIDEQAFDECRSMTIIYQGTKEQWDNIVLGDYCIESGVQVVCSDETITI